MTDLTTNEPTNEIEPGFCHCGCGGRTKPARQNDPKRGFVKGQPVRFIIGHHNKVRAVRTIAERFWPKVDKRGADDCWLWTASLGSDGYGQLSVKPDGRRFSAKAHRISYEIHYGPIPEGKLVCHSCDERYPVGDTTYRLCVNPAHLWLGDYTDNIQDCYDKKRRLPPPGHGLVSEDHPSSHFTNEQVIAWRIEFPQAGMTMADFARKYEIPRTTMVSILKRENYKHLP